MILAVVFGGLLGASIGSFLTVVRYRVPRGQSLVRPPSHCDACEEPLNWYDNLPMLSWILLRGRCRACGAAVPAIYPGIEALCGLIGAVAVGALWSAWR